MGKILLWIRNNRIKFFIIDYILLFGNVLVLNFLQKGIFLEADLVLMFIAINIFFCFIFLITKIWLFIITRFHITIRIQNFVELISYYATGFFLIINILFLFIVWFLKDTLNVFYYAMPWLIIIPINIYKGETTNTK